MLSVNLTHLIDDEKCYETVHHRQIAQELDLDKDVVQDMTTQLREGIDKSKPEVNL